LSFHFFKRLLLIFINNKPFLLLIYISTITHIN
jgi:hypothetical protein